MLVLILDPTHACLLRDGRLPDVPLGDASRPLPAVTSAIPARLPSPAGSRARGDGAGRDFVFITPRFPAPDGYAWVPLRAAADPTGGDDALWRLYVECVLGGWEPPTRAVDVWFFGDSPEMASRLAHLVACGEKRATMGWIDAAEKDGSPIAYEGGVSVITDAFGYPRMVLRTTGVRVTPFGEVDAASAAAEGEGDLSYAYWREAHEAYFSHEADKLGLVFDEHARIAVERFEVLHIVGRR